MCGVVWLDVDGLLATLQEGLACCSPRLSQTLALLCGKRPEPVLVDKTVLVSLESLLPTKAPPADQGQHSPFSPRSSRWPGFGCEQPTVLKAYTDRLISDRKKVGTGRGVSCRNCALCAAGQENGACRRSRCHTCELTAFNSY